MDRKIDLNLSVFELAQTYPELVEIMAELGFTEIKKTAVLHSIGKLMTIPKGANIKDIPLERVVKALREHGFTVEGLPSQGDEAADTVYEDAGATSEGGAQTASEAAAQITAEAVAQAASGERSELLKEYLRRLSAGEDLERVRADFVQNFSQVDASEIMQAEQQLMADGVPPEDVQQLCDIHSALFHGATGEEQSADKANTAASADQTANRTGIPADYSGKAERAAALAAVPGHPLHTFTRENEALAEIIRSMQEKLAGGEDVTEDLKLLREVSIHYAKKGDLLYPHLNVKYEISGPSNVMWTVDDEIRAELGELAGSVVRDDSWRERLQAVIRRADEMIYKESNILFPICTVNFTESEWMQIYQDARDYDDCLGVHPAIWPEAESRRSSAAISSGEEIVMPGGHLTPEQISGLLNTIPIEITFVDADNINRFFNEGPKLFKRPAMAIDREVFSCHPPKIEPMVRSIISDFRNGNRDSVPIWMEKNGRTVLVTYMAVRDESGSYIGTMELVQDMEFAKEYFSNQ